jgi:uncharacterized protein (DUF58 family)
MIPASSGPLWFLGTVCLLLLGIVLLMGYLAYSARNVSFQVSPEGLRISRSIYGRTIPAASLRLDSVKRVDLTEDHDYRIKWRTNGAGMPGYNTGWFKLRNGEKALLFLTDRRRVVHVPTRDRYSLLLSVSEPEQFIQTLNEVLASPGS